MGTRCFSRLIDSTLEAGDCLRMRVGDGNRFRNPGEQPARYALVISKEPLA